MPARDALHACFCRALAKDGWNVTHDPFRLSWGGRDMYVDLGAEQLVAAEKSGQLIAVEIKGFGGHSVLDDLEKAMGQYTVYRTVLTEVEPQRTLYLAVTQDTFRGVFQEPLGQLLVQKHLVHIVQFDPLTETVVRWTP